MDKIKKLILEGPPEDTPAGVYLRLAYWHLVRELCPSSDDFKAKLANYVNDPRYVGRSQAEAKERAGRLTNALTGGSVKGLSIDFTWKRFIESLVLLDVETLSVSLKAYRGRFKVERVVRSFCHPQADLLRTVNGEDNEDPPGSASEALSQFFQKPRQVAEQTMQHILLRLLWQLFAEYDIDEAKWRQLMAAYVNNPKNCPQIASRRSDKRHNLQGAIRFTKKLTWKKFLEALKAADINRLTCAFRCSVPGRPEAEVEFEVDMADLTFWSKGDESE